MDCAEDLTWVTAEVVTAALLNTHLRDDLLSLDLHTHGGGSGDGASTLGNLLRVVFADAAADPTATGDVRRNGTLLLGHNGSVVFALSPDAGAGTASLRSLGTGGTQAANGTHTHTLIAPVTGTSYGGTIASGTVALNMQRVQYNMTTGGTVLLTTATSTAGKTSDRLVVVAALFANVGSPGIGTFQVVIDGTVATSTAVEGSAGNINRVLTYISYSTLWTATTGVPVQARVSASGSLTIDVIHDVNATASGTIWAPLTVYRLGM